MINVRHEFDDCCCYCDHKDDLYDRQITNKGRLHLFLYALITLVYLLKLFTFLLLLINETISFHSFLLLLIFDSIAYIFSAFLYVLVSRLLTKQADNTKQADGIKTKVKCN